MKLDKDCIRSVLIYIEEHCVYEKDRFGKTTMHNVNLYELTKEEELCEIVVF